MNLSVVNREAECTQLLRESLLHAALLLYETYTSQELQFTSKNDLSTEARRPLTDPFLERSIELFDPESKWC